ncbi:hypothetical protein [Chengkuizengella axinellae]|uniref:Uncharacterized protein n=1 Tax=Chengkuizengella axinellae TaxID=3064388 RepID=A0ABT9J0I5_9BACL|nr:hypothetical protein [Chengkuizengella sp. 2205SS18-9]MDP5275122.1 hypothetical protein [Chengkuizengella sp. 2205SS18-9]
MINLKNLGHYRKGKLWINDLPRMDYDNIDRIELLLTINKGLKIKPCSLALELLLSPRQVSNYAFLGVDFIPNNENKLVITVCVSHDEGEKLDNNIASSSDEVHIGLPKEYGEAILSSVQKTLSEIPNFSGGILNFNIGAHGLVGSSQLSFSKVTEIIVKLLAIDPNISDDYQLEDVILKSLN